MKPGDEQAALDVGSAAAPDAFPVRYADSRRTRRVVLVAFVVAVAIVGTASVLVPSAVHQQDGIIGWVVPALAVLVPAAVMVWLIVWRGTVSGELHLNADGLQFWSGKFASPERDDSEAPPPLALAWEQIESWKFASEPEGRPIVILESAIVRATITFQLAVWEPEVARAFTERWTTLATAGGERPQRSSSPTLWKQALGWAGLALFLVMTLVLLFSGELSWRSALRLIALGCIVLPLVLKGIQARAGG